jgi:hypothetical protein
MRKTLYTLHHRKPTSIGGKNEPRNLIKLPCNKHAAWHLLFGNLTPERIAEEITKRYLDPDYELVARRTDVCFSQTNAYVPAAISSPKRGEVLANSAATHSYRMVPQSSRPSEEHTP